MPPTRPLRQRCNVKLNVFTAIPPDRLREPSSHVYDDPSSRSKSRRAVIDVSVPFNGVAAGRKHPTIPRLHPVSRSTARRLESLHELLPDLYVSFHTGNHLPAEVVTEDGAAFTHIIKITHATSKRQAGVVDVGRDIRRGLYTLILVVPAFAPWRHERRRVQSAGERNTTLLTEYQLLASRDFLSLALPYYSKMHPSDVLEGPIGSADRVRVLVTAPAGDGAATDIMSVAACYITFVSGESAQTVLECIDREEEVPAVWQDVIGEGEGGVQLIDHAAMIGE